LPLNRVGHVVQKFMASDRAPVQLSSRLIWEETAGADMWASLHAHPAVLREASVSNLPIPSPSYSNLRVLSISLPSPSGLRALPPPTFAACSAIAAASPPPPSRRSETRKWEPALHLVAPSKTSRDLSIGVPNPLLAPDFPTT
jgi:hypothetical protein